MEQFLKLIIGEITMKLCFRILAITFLLVGASSVNAATIINCAQACASCEKNQICICDPGDGYLCLDKKDKVIPLDLQSILESVEAAQ